MSVEKNAIEDTRLILFGEQFANVAGKVLFDDVNEALAPWRVTASVTFGISIDIYLNLMIQGVEDDRV